jgi:hypothetical protein
MPARFLSRQKGTKRAKRMGNLSAPRPVSKIQMQAKLKLALVGCGSRLAKARQWAGAFAKHVVGKLEVRTVQKIETLNERPPLMLPFDYSLKDPLAN